MTEFRERLKQSFLAASCAYTEACNLQRTGHMTKAELKKVQTVFHKAHDLWVSYKEN